MPEGTDRYLVDQSDLGARFEERFRALEQKVEEALRRNPLRDASMTDGAFRILDAAGNQQIVIGKQSDGTYGIWSYDDAGNVVLKLDDVGLRAYDTAGLNRVLIGLIASGNYGARVRDGNNGVRFSVENDGYKDPWLTSPMIEAGAFTAVTSASFAAVYQGHHMIISHAGMGMTVVVSTDVGTTAEFRVKNTATGTTTGVVSVGSGASVGHDFQWLHGSTLGGGPVRFDLEARRTGGAGNVIVYQPYSVSMIDPDACTSDGL